MKSVGRAAANAGKDRRKRAASYSDSSDGSVFHGFEIQVAPYSLASLSGFKLLASGLGIDFVCSSSAFENSKLIDFNFFSIAWIINYLRVISFLVCILAVGFSFASSAFENSKLIDFDLHSKIRS